MEYERYAFSQPMYGDVNVLRIGETLIDTGHASAVCHDEVRAALDGPLSGIERVLHTHPHIDHVGGSQTIDALARLPHIVPEGHREIIHDYADYVRRGRAEMTRLLGGFGTDESTWDVYFPVRDDYAEERIEIARELDDGDSISVGGDELGVISTPGHADPHIALYHDDSGTLFSGDLVDADGRFQYGPLLGDVGAYKESLRRVRELDPERLVPMHGPPMTDPGERIDASLSNAESTEERILTFLEHRGTAFARTFVTDELGVEGARAPFLTLVTYEYLHHLEERGEVSLAVTEEGIRAERL